MVARPIGSRWVAGHIVQGHGVNPGDVVRVTENIGITNVVFNETTGVQGTWGWLMGDRSVLWTPASEEPAEPQPEERYLIVYEYENGDLKTLANQSPLSFDRAVIAARRRNITSVPSVYLIPVRAMAKIDAGGNIERYT